MDDRPGVWKRRLATFGLERLRPIGAGNGPEAFIPSFSNLLLFRFDNSQRRC
jgi:hypothetical protein